MLCAVCVLGCRRFHDVTSYGEHRALNYWFHPPDRQSFAAPCAATHMGTAWGTVWAPCGHCVGTAWALRGHCILYEAKRLTHELMCVLTRARYTAGQFWETEWRAASKQLRAAAVVGAASTAGRVGRAGGSGTR